MVDDARVPTGGRRVVAFVWAATGAVHFRLALEGAAGPLVNGASAVLAGAAVAGVVALLVGGHRSTLLVAAVLGAGGVASFLVPRIVPLPGVDVSLVPDLWPFAGLLLDALVVRLAVFTLRRTSRSALQGG